MDEHRKRLSLHHPHPNPPLQTKAIDDSPDFFFVNVEYSIVKIPIKEITHVEGMKDYVKIYLSNLRKPVLTKSTLKGIEEKLPGQGFMRVHKSYIVNVNKIESIRRNQIKIGEFEIPVGETNLEELLKALNYSK